MAAGSLGSLVVSLTAETAQFTAALDKASYTAKKNFNDISSFAKTAAGSLAALYGATSIVGFVKTQIDAADATGKMAQKVGMSVEELSKLQYAAKLADVDTGQLQVGLVKLSKGMVEAANGTGQARNAFAAMGLSVKNADGSLKNSGQMLTEVADKFATYGDSANKTALAVQLFGKSGADLIPLLNAGSAGIAESANELERFGAVISESAAKNAEIFNDNLTRLTTVGSAFGKSIANEILPYLNQLAEEFLIARANGMGFFEMMQMGFRTGNYEEQYIKVLKEIDYLQNGKAPKMFGKDAIEKDIENLQKQKRVLEDLIKAQQKKDAPQSISTQTTVAPFSADLEKMQKEAEKYAKGLASAQESNTKFSASISEMAQRAQQDIAGMFMTEAQKKHQQDLITINKNFLDTQAAITKQYTEGKLTLEAYNAQMGILGGQYDYAITQSEEVYAKQEELNSSYEYGASIALAKYANESRNLANLSSGVVVSSIRSVEDGLFNMITGAQSASAAIKSMVVSILSDMAKLAIRQGFTTPLVSALGGALGSAFGGMSTSSIMSGSAGTGGFSGAGNFTLPSFAVGTNYVPQDMVAQIHKGEAIVPAAYNPSAGGGGGTNNVVVNVNMQDNSVNADDANKLGIMIGNVVKSELIKQKRAGGILA